jgi:hypothetical protein
MHGRSGSEAVVNQDDRAIPERKGLAAVAIVALAARQFLLLLTRNRLDGSVRNSQLRDQVVTQNTDAP